MENEQREHDEMIRQTGIDAYAEAVAEMLSSLATKNGREMDDAEIEMIKQGIARTMNPPRPQPIVMPPMPPRMKSPQLFREETEDRVTIYDWGFIIQQCSHYHRFTDCDVSLYCGNENFLNLQGEAAAAFWAWQEEIFERSNWRPEEPSGEETNA